LNYRRISKDIRRTYLLAAQAGSEMGGFLPTDKTKSLLPIIFPNSCKNTKLMPVLSFVL